MDRPLDIKDQTSSGGVVFRRTDSGIEVVLIMVSMSKNWCLPKGLIDKQESPAEAALREVREETGLHGKIIDKIGHISYWYVINDERLKMHKTVHFFLMDYVGGSTEDHDHEVDEARWFPIDEALTTLVHKNERDIMMKAKMMIEEMGRDTGQWSGVRGQ